MTRMQKDRAVQEILSRYDDGVGSLIVGDDFCLSRLLGTLQLDREDREVGNFLCSFLVA